MFKDVTVFCWQAMV